MTVLLRSWAAALGGEVFGNRVVCPGPGHSAKDRSLAVKVGTSGEILVHSFAGDDWRECRDYVRGMLGLSPFLPGQKLKVPPHRERKPVEEKPANNREHALRPWHQAGDPRGTPVETYLRNRCLKFPEGDCSQFIRFHKSCPFGKERYPALIALIRGIENDLPQAVQRTALCHDGTCVKRNGKTFRMSLGSIAGGAVKIDDDVTTGLCIGEGLETCLSARQLGLRPVWSVISDGGIARFPVLPGIDQIHIIRENDPNGASARAVKKCADRWYEAGREVFIVASDIGNDLNDELLGAVQ